jgi:hypothetical protein
MAPGTLRVAFSHKMAETNYSMGYAESADDGRNWTRGNNQDLIVSCGAADEWDSDMVCYPYLHSSGGRHWLFYNGNGYGASGIGWAEWIE